MIQTITKWLKLRKVAEGLAGKPLDIHLSTEFEQSLNLRSYVVFGPQRVDIFLNAKYAKEMDWIIESVAHELAHVYFNDDGHVERHQTWDSVVSELRTNITEKMGS